MRTFTFGLFDSQAAYFTRMPIAGTSMVIDRDAANNDATPDPNKAAWLVSGNVYSNAKYKALVKVDLSVLRAQLGHAPVLLNVKLWTRETEIASRSTAFSWGLFRLLKTPDFTDASYRNLDANGPVRWTDDGYSPQHGVDVAVLPFAQLTIPVRTIEPTDYTDAWDLTSELAYALLANRDLMFMLRWLPLNTAVAGGGQIYQAHWSTAGKRPYLEGRYQLPVELYKAKADDTIDLAHPLDGQNGLDEYRMYIGAVERSETGTAVKGFLKVLRSSAIAHLELWDDYPEWGVPVQVAGTGTGALTHVSLAKSAVSQRYYVKMTSSTAFQVKGTAYKNNATALNSVYGTSGWTGAVGSDWTAPDGGLTIPSAGWRKTGLAVNDEFEFAVLGNTSDTAWPSDAGAQVEITTDLGGAPDEDMWRPAEGQRTRSTASVTVGATTKTFPTLAVVPALWPIGNPAFVADASAINHGTVKSIKEAAVGTEAFTGSGLDDLTASAGNSYSGPGDATYRVKIDATGTPDTFTWSRDGGATWAAAGVAITGAAQHLEHGVMVAFAATTGHTLNDHWDIACTSWGVELENLTNDSHVFAANAVVGTTLPFRTLTPAVWTQTSAAAGPAQTLANRVYLASTSGLNTNDVLFIQDLTDPDLTEEVTVSAVQPTYVDLDANLSQDYAAGALVMLVGSGERAFWARPVATASTTEERKDFRLNVRTL